MKNFSIDKMYTRVKVFASSNNLEQTLKALSYAREKHEGQFRKSGEPYIIHPLTMAVHAMALGVKDDTTLAVILLHDVVEDCKVSIDEIPFNNEVKEGVASMTFEILECEVKEQALLRYYRGLAKNKAGGFCKVLDRCHNTSSMAGTFTVIKLISYIEETRQHVYPLMKKLKDRYHDLSDALFILKYHIVGVVDAIDNTLMANEKNNN